MFFLNCSLTNPEYKQTDMKYLTTILIALCLLCPTGCHDDSEDFVENQTSTETLEVVHPNERDKPYPREEHELYLNPAPLIVPDIRKEDEYLEFELSQDTDFPEEGTFRSGKLSWNMYNAHRQLTAGEWYWRYRKTDTNGNAGSWSEVYKFTVTGKEPVFVTPEWQTFRQHIPTDYPRIHCYLSDDLEKVRPTITGHREYSQLISRVKTAMSHTPAATDLYDESKASTLNQYTFSYLYTTYLLTGDTQYQDKMLEYAHILTATALDDGNLVKSNFQASYVVSVLSALYDACHERLTENERSIIEKHIAYVVNYYYNQFRGDLENHIFNNHIWQITLQGMLQGALVICQEYPEAMKALEYFYEIWTARAPATGFNRDGAWVNGTGYFNTNSYTLYYMPMLFSKITGTDFLKHPWYQNVGQYLVYSWLPDTPTTGFGDVDGTGTPARQRVAFADFIARETGNAYAAWYVKETGNVVHTDYAMRLYRMARSYISYGSELDESELENYIWYQDIGEGVAYTNMVDRSNNMALSFRSSPFGSGSHTLADQNSFNLLYKGTYVYMNAGYYQNFSDKHNLLQFRHTRGHNTIMVNHIGQPFTTRAYGNIVRGLNGANIAYFLGDASHAYCGISEYPLWQKNFAKAGISQTPEYGFGETPLNNYKRHIFMLRPDKAVIYDDLGADEAATWQWLLHSPVEFHVAGNKATTSYSTDNGSFTAVAQLFSGQNPQITVTNEWYPGGEPSNQDPDKYPKQWHLTADFAACTNNRILTIIQVSDDGTAEDITHTNNRFAVGNWVIEAEMDADKPAAITITNKATGTVFGSDGVEITIGGASYKRRQKGSSVLYDKVHGKMQFQETTDKKLQSTRALH